MYVVGVVKEAYEVTVVHEDDTTEVIEVVDSDWMQNHVYRPWPAEEVTSE